MTNEINIALTGIGATALVDLWSIVRERVWRVPAPNYALVGRWMAHMSRGTFRHAAIGAAAPMRGERTIGWTAHYLIGIAFALSLAAVVHDAWFEAPTLAPALLFGIATVAAPFLLMQPGMGAGFAASRTPHPRAARLQSLLTHAIFGLGLYATAWIVRIPSSMTTGG